MKNKQFWLLIENQWRQVVPMDLIVASRQAVEHDMELIGHNKVVKNLWDDFDDEEDDE